jgi:hypothetical protein
MRGTAELPDSDQARHKLTQPLNGLFFFIAVLFAGATGAALLALAFGAGGITILGLGGGPACVTAPINGVSVDSTTALSGIRPGATAGSGSTVTVCVQHPSAGQHALAFLTEAPNELLFLAILVLVLRLLVVVRHEGPFVTRVASRLRFLGWFILAGGLTASVVQSAATAYLLQTTISDPVPVLVDTINGANPWVPLLAGSALLTLARIMRAGARMQDDLAGTV